LFSDVLDMKLPGARLLLRDIPKDLQCQFDVQATEEVLVAEPGDAVELALVESLCRYRVVWSTLVRAGRKGEP
jgi:hypothetical protein